jgi:hypothetical protein
MAAKISFNIIIHLLNPKCSASRKLHVKVDNSYNSFWPRTTVKDIEEVAK